MKFLVHWENTDDTEDTWEPYKSLKTNIVFHNYLVRKDMELLIPVNFRTNTDFQRNKKTKKESTTRKTCTADLSTNSNIGDDLETPLSPANPYETTQESSIHYVDTYLIHNLRQR